MMRYRTFGRFGWAVMVLLLAVAGCSSIPDSGPVGTIPAPPGSGDLGSQPVFNPRGPTPDAPPEDLLELFITAGQGAADDYKVAREFLTPELAATWQPEERVIIFRADPKIVETRTEGTYQIQLEIAGSIDSRGIRNDSASGTTESITVEMLQRDGQWRISGIPNGIMVSESRVSLIFSPRNLYFYSSSHSHWVPDVRWFVNRQGIAANIVEAMLVGPAPYLEGAVTSAFPESATLAKESVPIVSGTATVDLSRDILQDATDLRLQQMEQQLRANLTGLNTVSSVEMTAGQPIDLGEPHPELVTPIGDQPVGSTQIALFGNELHYYQAGEVLPIDGVPSVAAYSPRDPAMSLNQKNVAFLNGGRRQLLTTGPGQEVRVAATGQQLTAPSFDPGNWVWTAGKRDGGAQVLAVPPGGGAANTVKVSAPWLGDRTVTELRISRDGARALVVTEQAGATEVLLSGVTRSARGVPESLGTPFQLSPAGRADTAKWVTEDAIVVADTAAEGPVTAEILDLGGEPKTVAPVQGVLNVSAGTGTEDIFVQTADAIYSRVGNSWLRQKDGVHDPAFPG
jgi:hypothetical protein